MYVRTYIKSTMCLPLSADELLLVYLLTKAYMPNVKLPLRVTLEYTLHTYVCTYIHTYLPFQFACKLVVCEMPTPPTPTPSYPPGLLHWVTLKSSRCYPVMGPTLARRLPWHRRMQCTLPCPQPIKM